ncbi:MAG: hypothetical protein ACR2NX_16735 [Chthoniobacterales bacterium]
MAALVGLLACHTRAQDKMATKQHLDPANAAITVTFSKNFKVKDGIDCKFFYDLLGKYTQDHASWSQIKFNENSVLDTPDEPQPCATPGAAPSPNGTRVSVAQHAGFANVSDLQDFLAAIKPKPE